MLNIFAIVINIFGRDANTIYITIFVEGEKLWNLKFKKRKRFFTRIYGRKNKCIKTNNIKLGTR